MRRFYLWLLVFGLGAFLFPNPSVACGCGIAIHQDSAAHTATVASGDTEVFASLNYGTETLTFVRDFTRSTAGGKLLLVPVPAEPAKATIDIVDQTPKLAGTDVLGAVQTATKNVGRLFLGTQIYPEIITGLLTQPTGVTSSSATFGAIGQSAPTGAKGITIAQHLEKNGLIAELISTENANDLSAYFIAKNLPITPAQLPTLQDYIGHQASFAAIWADPRAASISTDSSSVITSGSSVSAIINGPVSSGFTITFPATTLTYPLKPNAAFGSTPIKETLHIAGFVTPKLPTALKSVTTISYLHHGMSSLGEQLSNSTMESLPSDQATSRWLSDSGGRYTDVTIDAPSVRYTDDLIVTDQGPARATIADSLLTSGWVGVAGLVTLFILLSMIAATIAGRFTFRGYSMARLSKIGVANMLSIIGVIIAALVAFRRVDPTNPPLSMWQRLGFILLFTIGFDLLVLAVQAATTAFFHS